MRWRASPTPAQCGSAESECSSCCPSSNPQFPDKDRGVQKCRHWGFQTALWASIDCAACRAADRGSKGSVARATACSRGTGLQHSYN